MKDKILAFFKKYRWETFVFVLTGALSKLIFFFSNLRFPNDDQFILYRYIDNIAFGHGFVFNLGEKILGSTTPLFTLIAALFKWCLPFVYTPDLVAYLNISFFALAAIPFYRLSKRLLSDKFTLLSVLIFALSLSRMIPEGMETPLFLLFILTFLELLLSEKYRWSAVFLSLAILTRPDAGLVAVLTAIYWWQKRGFKETIKLTLITFLVALPWLLFSISYFGSFIPQSLATKIHSNDIVFQTHYQALKVQLAHLSRLYWGRLFDPENILLQSVFNLLPVLVLIGLGVKKKINSNNWLFLAIPIAYLISFSISNPVMFPWYLSETEPFWILLTLIGVETVISYWRNDWFKALVIVLILVGPTALWYKNLTTESRGSKIPLFTAGNYLKTKIKTDETIGISNIGIVSYITSAPIVDFVGLTNTYAVKFYPVKRDCLSNSQMYVIPPELIKYSKPDWMVAGDGEMDKCFASSEWMKTNYSLDKRDGSLNIYRKNGLVKR